MSKPADHLMPKFSVCMDSAYHSYKHRRTFLGIRGQLEMKLKRSWLIALIFAILFGVQSIGHAEEVVVLGRLQIFELDADDNVTRLSIENEDDRFVLEVDHIDEDLLKLVGSKVEVVGTSASDENGFKIIRVRTCRKVISED